MFRSRPDLRLPAILLTADALARRTRGLFLDAEASAEAAGVVAALVAKETGRDAAWASAQAEAVREQAARGAV